MFKPYRNKGVLERLYLDEGLTCEEIGDRYGVPSDTIDYWIKKRHLKDRAELPNTSYKDKETLERLYVDEGLTQEEIADKLGNAPGTIWRWIRKHNIERPQRPATCYTIEGYPMWECGNEQLRVHQLLAIAEGYDPHEVFSDNHVIHHKNGIKWANWGDNIELITQSKHGLHHQGIVDGKWHDKQTLWELYVEESMSMSEIAEKLECGVSTIGKYLRKFDIPIKNNQGEYEQYVHPLRKW